VTTNGRTEAVRVISFRERAELDVFSEGQPPGPVLHAEAEWED